MNDVTPQPHPSQATLPAISTEEQLKQYEDAKDKIKEALQFRSRTFLGLCKNIKCYNLRRHASSFCQQCADKKRTPKK